MKTIGTNPQKESAGNLDLIKDAPVAPLSGAGIGELVGGQSIKAQKIDPAAEEAYWKEHHAGQTFAQNHSYEKFGPAYRAGYEGYARFGVAGKNFDETETKLRERYETENGSPKLPWTVVRPASHAAWHKLTPQKRPD